MTSLDTLKQAAQALRDEADDRLDFLGEEYKKLAAALEAMASNAPEQVKPLLILSSGEYSDYSWSGPYRPLKKFTVREALDAFKAQWKPNDEWDETPTPEEFEGWLVSQRWIDPISSDEIHIGGYGQLDIAGNSLALELNPIATPEHDAKVRDAALEEAAKACESRFQNTNMNNISRAMDAEVSACAYEIRALKSNGADHAK